MRRLPEPGVSGYFNTRPEIVQEAWVADGWAEGPTRLGPASARDHPDGRDAALAALARPGRPEDPLGASQRSSLESHRACFRDRPVDCVAALDLRADHDRGAAQRAKRCNTVATPTRATSALIFGRLIVKLGNMRPPGKPWSGVVILGVLSCRGSRLSIVRSDGGTRRSATATTPSIETETRSHSTARRHGVRHARNSSRHTRSAPTAAHPQPSSITRTRTMATRRSSGTGGAGRRSAPPAMGARRRRTTAASATGAAEGDGGADRWPNGANNRAGASFVCGQNGKGGVAMLDGAARIALKVESGRSRD